MSSQVINYQAHAYLVSTSVYEGPLDLLLQLIEKFELDITKLALAQVTDQFLSYLNNLSDQNPAEVSSFIVIAAKLIQIKSEALLPRPPIRQPGEEDPGEALAQQLILYKQYKTIAGWLVQRETAGLKTYLRLADAPKFEGKLDMGGFTLNDLVAAAYRVLIKGEDLPPLSKVVSIPLMSIRDRIKKIMFILRDRKEISFFSLLESKENIKIEVVVTFLAMLELIKQRMIEATQDSLFSDIRFQPIGEWDDSAEFDLELEDYPDTSAYTS